MSGISQVRAKYVSGDCQVCVSMCQVSAKYVSNIRQCVSSVSGKCCVCVKGVSGMR